MEIIGVVTIEELSGGVSRKEALRMSKSSSSIVTKIRLGSLVHQVLESEVTLCKPLTICGAVPFWHQPEQSLAHALR